MTLYNIDQGKHGLCRPLPQFYAEFLSNSWSISSRNMLACRKSRVNMLTSTLLHTQPLLLKVCGTKDFFKLNIGGMTLLKELSCSSFYADQLDFKQCLPKAMEFCFVLVNAEHWAFVAAVRFNCLFRLLSTVYNKTIMKIGQSSRV